MQLVALGPMLPYEQVYREGPERTDIDQAIVSRLARYYAVNNDIAEED